MGGKSGSKSTSTQTTNQTDRRVGAADGSLVATEGATVNYDLQSVDPEIAQAALAEAFGFGRSALAAVTDSQGQIVELAERGDDQFEGLKHLLTTTAIVGVAAAYFLSKR